MRPASNIQLPGSVQKVNDADKQALRTLLVLMFLAIIIFAGGALLFSRVFSVHVTSVDDYVRYELSEGTYQTRATAQGTVSAAKTVVEVPDVDDGTVETVSVAEGDVVEKDQALVVIKSPSLENALAEASAAYEQAKTVQDQASSQYSNAKAQVEQAQEAIDESKAAQQAQIDAEMAAQQQAQDAAEQAAREALQAQQNHGGDESDGTAGASSTETGETDDIDLSDQYTGTVDTTITVDPALEAALSSAKAAASSAADVLEEAETNTASARTAYRTAQSKVDSLSISASSAGKIVDLKVQVGMNTSMLKEQGSLMQIEDPNSLVVACSVPETEVSSMARGQEAKVKGIATDGSELTAVVSEVAEAPNGNTADDGSPLYDVSLTLESTENVQSNKSVAVNILLHDYGIVYYVPSTAVENEGDKSYVEIIYIDKTTAKHQVKVIAELDTGEKIIQGNALGQGIIIREDLVQG